MSDGMRHNRAPEERITRRHFLKDAVLIIGGAAIMSLAPACQSAPATTSVTTNADAATTTASPATSPGAATTTKAPATTSQAATTATSQPSTAASQTAAAPPSSSTPPATSFVYAPPEESPPLELTPNCTTYVAFDRRYSIEHIWVKDIGEGRAVMRISDKLPALMAAVSKISLPKVDSDIRAGTSFGESEGFKMTVDLIAPVSGRVLQVNTSLFNNPGLLNLEPFVKGWMLCLELSQPQELDDMLSPEEYMALQAKDALAGEH